MSDDKKWNATVQASNPDDVYERVDLIELRDEAAVEAKGPVSRRDLIARTLTVVAGSYVTMRVVEKFTGHQMVGSMPLHAASLAVQLD
jgi:hypothetical protein